MNKSLNCIKQVGDHDQCKSWWYTLRRKNLLELIWYQHDLIGQYQCARQLAVIYFWNAFFSDQESMQPNLTEEVTRISIIDFDKKKTSTFYTLKQFSLKFSRSVMVDNSTK